MPAPPRLRVRRGEHERDPALPVAVVSRRAAGLTAVLLLLAMLALALAVLPLHVLPGAHPVVNVSRDFSAADQAREQAFHSEVRPPAYAALALSLLVAGALGLTRLGARLVSACGRHWPVQVVLGTLALTVISRLVILPLDLRSEAVSRDYGLSTRSWLGFAVDTGKGILVTAVLAALGLLAVLAIARRAPRTWWAWSAAAVAVLVAVGSFLYPVVIEPVFNSFTPLPAGQLRDDLLGLARQEGVPARDVLVADASRRTTALNAYVSGFGSTRRIVIYDTLLEQATPAEIRVVVGHELGHAAEGDVLNGTGLGMLGGAAAVCGLALLLSWQPLLRRAGARGPADPRIVPLVLFVVAAGTLLTAPVVNLATRHVEQRADLHALQATDDPEAFIASFRRLAVTNLSDLSPGPVLTAFFATHPSAPERIAFARAWAAQQAAQR